MRNINYYFESIFYEINKDVLIRKILMFSTLFFLLLSIYNEGYLLYFASLTSFIMHLITWMIKLRISKNLTIAHEFQKISLLYTAYGTEPNDIELSFLKSKVSFKVQKLVSKKLKDNSSTDETQNSENNSLQGDEKLKAMIHENCFWNHFLYKSSCRENVLFLAVTVFCGIIGLLYLIPLIKSDPNYSLPRLAFAFLSFTIIYEFLETTIAFYNASTVMHKIDTELSCKNNFSTPHLLKIFSQYCYYKAVTPTIREAIYLKNRQWLNKEWGDRNLYKR